MGTSTLHIKTEIECHVYLFDEEKGIATPGKWFNLEVRKGEQDLLFVNAEDENCKYRLSYQVEENNCDYRIGITRDVFTRFSPKFLQQLELAKKGNPQAQFNVGLYYENGQGVEQNHEESFKWYTEAAIQGLANAQYKLGRYYLANRNYSEAVKWFQSATEQGYSLAQYTLGLFYINGLGTQKNVSEAIRLFKIVASQSSGEISEEAQQRIEECFLAGIGIEEYATDAIQFFQEDNQKDNPQAQFQLGICYKNGIGVDKNIYKAVELFRESANQGNANAENELGMCFKRGEGVIENQREAFDCFRKSAELGNAEGQCNLGSCYYWGKGVRQDYEKAKVWFEKSANQGNACAQYLMGVGCRTGDWGKRDYKEAMKWAKMSAEQGFAPAQEDLANSYYHGWVVQNYSEAVKWYIKAAKQGNCYAQYKLAKCYCDGLGIKQNTLLAAHWMQKAAENGHAEAKIQIEKYPYSLNIEGTIEKIVSPDFSNARKKLEPILFSKAGISSTDSHNEIIGTPYYLFFDTETTGVPKNYNAPASNTSNWPRLVQLGWILTDEKGNTLSSGCEIVKPDGFVIPVDAVRVHGITTEKAIKEGKPLREVIDRFLKDARQSKIIVGHNISFDQLIVGAELCRLGITDTISRAKNICTMETGTDFCKIPGNYGYKWPQLQELYKKLFGTNFEDAHDAMVDVKATKKCFFELKRLGVINKRQ